MISPKKSVNNLSNSNKFKPLNEAALQKLQIDLQPFLKDKDLHNLKILIKKHEPYSINEIENILFTNIKSFQPGTHHKIRDFVKRRMKNLKKNSTEFNTIYQSDDSNLVSPYSRDSFSSKSDINLSPSTISSLKTDITNLWKYPTYQKEICQLLFQKGDLEMLSSSSIAIDFENLKPTTLLALQEFIEAKNKLLEKYLSNENLKILHDIWINETLSDEKISEIYEVIKKREPVKVNENGIFTIDMTSLKTETVMDLIRLFRPNHKINKPIQPTKRPSIMSTQQKPDAIQAPQPGNTINQMRSNQITKAPPENHSRFDNEQLRYLSSKIKECTKNESISDILRIIKENETVDQQGGGISLNVKKMKDVTISKLFKFINSNKI